MKFTQKCKVCIMNGDIEGLEKLSLKIPVEKWRCKIDVFAADVSRAECVKWLWKNGYKIRWSSVIQAARSNIEILELARREFVDADVFILLSAVHAENYDILEWSQCLTPPMVLGSLLISSALDKRDPIMLRWLLSHGCQVTKEIQYCSLFRKEELSQVLFPHLSKVEKVWKMWYETENILTWPPEEVIKDVLEMLQNVVLFDLI